MLVAPVNKLEPEVERTIEFRGLNRKDYVEDGEMSAMINLTSDRYPVLTPRKPRGTMSVPSGVTPVHIISRYERIAMIGRDGSGNYNLYYTIGGTSFTKISEDINHNEVGPFSDKTRMVAINTKICFFPQKTYLEIVRNGSVVTIGTYGSLEETKALQGTTVTLSNEDARINVGSHRFAYDDALSLVGTLTYTANNEQKTVEVNASCLVESIDGNTLILPRETFIELTGDGVTSATYTGTIDRTMPDIEHVIEWNNRLWGCNSIDNVIYACKLGDPKNWQYYQGTAMDSYYAQQGTDEDFTGSAVYSQHIIFFKQNSLVRVYGTAPSNFQIQNMECFGLEKGSDKSSVTINDMVFYKSKIGLMAYEGNEPYLISEKLNTKYRNVVAGTDGRKYIASCEIVDSNPTEYEVVVLDIDNAFWHREDSTRFKDTCYYDGSMYFIDGTDKIQVINPDTPTETGMEWSATFGPFTEYIENRKIYSKLAIRLNAKSDSSVVIKIKVDDGAWETVERYATVVNEGNFIPIVPRRCDHYSVQLSGTGDVAIESLTRRYRVGTGGKL